MGVEYELIDSGAEEKLERFGEYILRRPDPQALWEKRTPDLWRKAHARYERAGKSGVWYADGVPREWQILYAGFSFLIRPTSFKHVGLFPEQRENWEWVATRARGARVLNLFAYTGAASMAAARVGASVVHVDASKTAVLWAQKNAELSELAAAPIRWIVDDALSFVTREIKRGERYDGIILDPPSFGHGPKDELWKIERDLPTLIRACAPLLSDEPRFMLLNGYAAGYSHFAFENLLAPLFSGGHIEGGELTIPESTGRVLPAGIFARWSKDR